MNQKPFITTSVNQLQNKSETAQKEEFIEIIHALLEAIPPDVLGLAAPQILRFKRVFLACLSCGKYAFVNPSFRSRSPDKVPSTESCLSLPNVVRTITRHKRVTITGNIFKINEDSFSEELELLTLQDRDAFVVQHEYDHLDGILIIDLPKVMTAQDNARKRQYEREEKLAKKRQEKRIGQNQQKSQPTSRKTLLKMKAEARKQKKQDQRKKKREQMRVEEHEQEMIMEKSLFEGRPAA